MGAAHLRCPVCKSEALLGPLREHDASYTLYQCVACELQFWSPFEGASAEWYEEHCSTRGSGIYPESYGWDGKRFLRKKLLPGSRLFEIGCGSGNFLKAARAEGYKVAGIDHDRASIRIAREKHALTAEPVSIEEFSRARRGETFDIVALFQVVEHLSDPLKCLSYARELVCPGGYVVVGVPNRNSWQLVPRPADIPPHHISCWDRNAMYRLLSLAGYSVISTEVSPPQVAEIRVMLDNAIFKSALRRWRRAAVRGLAAKASSGGAYSTVRRGVLSVYRAWHLFLNVPAVPIWAYAKARGFEGATLLAIAQRPLQDTHVA